MLTAKQKWVCAPHLYNVCFLQPSLWVCAIQWDPEPTSGGWSGCMQSQPKQETVTNKSCCHSIHTSLTGFCQFTPIQSQALESWPSLTCELGSHLLCSRVTSSRWHFHCTDSQHMQPSPVYPTPWGRVVCDTLKWHSSWVGPAWILYITHDDSCVTRKLGLVIQL